MAKEYNAALLRQIEGQIYAKCSECSAALESVISAVEKLSQSPYMSSTGWTTISDYLAHVHASCIGIPLLNLFSVLPASFREYYSKFIALDADCAAIINTDILEQLKPPVSTLLAALTAVEEELKGILNGISDITEQSYTGLPSALETQAKIATDMVTVLADNINQIDSDGMSAVSTYRTTKEAVLRIIAQYSSTSFNAGQYSASSLANSQNFQDLHASLQGLSAHIQHLEANADTVNGLREGVEKQWQERAERAEKIKFGLAILEGVIGIAATATMGPVGTAVVSGIAGGISSAVSEGLDQWSSGSADAYGYDYGRIAFYGSIGAARSTIQSGISYGFATIPPKTGFVSNILLAGGKNFVNTAVDEGFAFVEAVGTGTMDEWWDDVSSLDHWEAATGNFIFGTVVDGSVGWAKGGFGSTKDTGKAVVEKPSKIKRIGKATMDTAKDIGLDFIKDTGKAGITALAETEDGEAAWHAMCDEATDLKKWQYRVSTSVVENSFSYAYEEGTYDYWERQKEKRYENEVLNNSVLISSDTTSSQTFFVTDNGNIYSHEHIRTENVYVLPSEGEREQIRKQTDAEMKLEEKLDKWKTTTTLKSGLASYQPLEDSALPEMHFTPSQDLESVVRGKTPYMTREQYAKKLEAEKLAAQNAQTTT